MRLAKASAARADERRERDEMERERDDALEAAADAVSECDELRAAAAPRAANTAAAGEYAPARPRPPSLAGDGGATVGGHGACVAEIAELRELLAATQLARDTLQVHARPVDITRNPQPRPRAAASSPTHRRRRRALRVTRNPRPAPPPPFPSPPCVRVYRGSIAPRSPFTFLWLNEEIFT